MTVASVAPIFIAIAGLLLFDNKIARTLLVLSCFALSLQPGTFKGVVGMNDNLNGWRDAVAAVSALSVEEYPVLVRSGFVEEAWLKTNADPVYRDYMLCTVNGLYPVCPAGRHCAVYPIAGREGIELYKEPILARNGFWLIAWATEKSLREMTPRDLGAERTLNIEQMETFKNVVCAKALVENTVTTR